MGDVQLLGPSGREHEVLTLTGVERGALVCTYYQPTEWWEQANQGGHPWIFWREPGSFAPITGAEAEGLFPIVWFDAGTDERFDTWRAFAAVGSNSTGSGGPFYSAVGLAYRPRCEPADPLELVLLGWGNLCSGIPNAGVPWAALPGYNAGTGLPTYAKGKEWAQNALSPSRVGRRMEKTGPYEWTIYGHSGYAMGLHPTQPEVNAYTRPGGSEFVWVKLEFQPGRSMLQGGDCLECCEEIVAKLNTTNSILQAMDGHLGYNGEGDAPNLKAHLNKLFGLEGESPEWPTEITKADGAALEQDAQGVIDALKPVVEGATSAGDPGSGRESIPKPSDWFNSAQWEPSAGIPQMSITVPFSQFSSFVAGQGLADRTYVVDFTFWEPYRTTFRYLLACPFILWGCVRIFNEFRRQ